ncbi:hypothetical protein IWW39_005194 [Coemansia spiralis]|uniref:Transmembrane protein 135 N-terminal domain-containing protein n=1 Tax=Coemansia spiralis TaxID=417178 RepID=A0A9W8GFW0_9FUNG|nr:hypothetical protein IWW39_005194 [Coemansia spiralis]
MDIADTTYLLNSFIEAFARVTSYALTDREKESVVRGFRQFHQRLERISSSTSLRQLAIESKKRQEDTAKCHHEGKSCPQNAIRGFIKAFTVGYAVKYGLDTVPHVISLRVFTQPSLLLRAISRDTLSFASFLSAVIGSYKAFLCAMRRIHGGKGNDYTNALVAGMLSGLVAIKLDRNRSRRAAITLYMVSRALQYGCVWLFNRWDARRQLKEDNIRGKAMKRAHSELTMASPAGRSADLRMSAAGTRAGPSGRDKWSPETDEKGKEAKREGGGQEASRHVTRFIRNHAPTALLSVSVAVIVLTLVFHTDVIPRGYMNFLSRTAGYERFYPRKAPIALKTIAYDIRRSYESGNSLNSKVPHGVTTKEHISTIPIARDIIGALDDSIRHDFTACGIFHPKTSSCRMGMLSTALHCFPIALKVYTPLNAAVLVLFKRGLFLKDPRGMLLKLVKSSVRSSIFFTLLVTGIINGACGMRQLLGRETYFGYLASGLLSGLSVLVEAPSRRVELAMYCFLRALESGWDVGVKLKWWANVRHGEVALFSAAMGVLMTIYQNDPTTIGLTYHSVLTRIFGRN